MKNMMVLSVLLLVASVEGAELLVNGDFSGGSSNWTITDGGVYNDFGQSALKVWATEGLWDVGWAQQDVPATPGQTYTLSADALNPSDEPLPNTGGKAFIKLEFYDGTGTIINGPWGTELDTIDGAAAQDTWIPLSGSMVAPAGSVTVRAVPMVQDTGGGVSVAWFDNVSLIGASIPVINDPDFNDDGIVNLVDFAGLAGVWGQISSTYNLAGEEFIDLEDLQAFAAAWMRKSPYPGYELVWYDEFNGTSVDTTKWGYETGGGGWGNNELQYYTNGLNSSVTGGNLVIEAREQAYGGRNYTSSRMVTNGKASWTYGRMEARIKLPYGQGMWPAFWMMPTAWQVSGWPDCGEIDIMEAVNTMDWVKSSLHYGEIDGGGGHPSYGSAQYYLPGGGNFSDDFHIYGMEWEEGVFTFFVDGVQIGSTSSWWSTEGPYPAPFNKDFFFILNIAVGGDWPGSPNGSTVFPQQMLVDYVRVYQASP